MKKTLAFILVCVIILGVLTAAGCASSTVGKLKKVRESGKLVVYTSPYFPPFEFIGENGIEGVDVEIAKAIAAELGAAAEVRETSFSALPVTLKSGKGDAIISGITITDGRSNDVDFSEPYIISFQYLILAGDSDIEVMEDLAGKKVGVVKDYTCQFLMVDEIGEGGALEHSNTELKEYNSVAETVTDLKNGRIDAVVMDEYAAKYAAEKNGLAAKELRYKNGGAVKEEYGVAIPKGNEDLLEEINAVIGRLKEEGKILEWLRHYSEQFSD